MYQQMLGFYRSDHRRDGEGYRLPGRQKVRATTLISHLSYLSDVKILGALYGAEIVVPLVHTNIDIENGPSGTETRMGDVAFSPLMLQWQPVSFLGKPLWQRFNLMFTAPTGSYSKNSDVNVGDNVWQVNPHYAFTWELSDKADFSGRIHYSWFDKNSDVAMAKDLQSGAAVHTNFGASYAFGTGVRVGLAGYHLQQISDDEVDGHAQGGSRSRVWGAGPGLMYQRQSRAFYANAYQEWGARNMSEGFRVQLRYLHFF